MILLAQCIHAALFLHASEGWPCLHRSHVVQALPLLVVSWEVMLADVIACKMRGSILKQGKMESLEQLP